MKIITQSSHLVLKMPLLSTMLFASHQFIEVPFFRGGGLVNVS